MPSKPPSRRETVAFERVVRIGLSRHTIDDFIRFAGQSRADEREAVRALIADAENEPDIIDGLFERYETAQRSDTGLALLILSIIGELRSRAALDRLIALVWTRAPEAEPAGHGALSEVDVLEMLQSKAAEGIAYLPTTEAERETLRIAAEHPAASVRSAAIAAYLHHAPDHERARARLLEILRRDDASSLDRTSRLVVSDPAEFNAALTRFYDLHPEHVAPEAERPAPPPEPTEPPRRLDG